MINEFLNLVFNTNIVVYPSIGLILLLYYIAEFFTSVVLVLYCMQKAKKPGLEPTYIWGLLPDPERRLA